jgi:hypothetical protein
MHLHTRHNDLILLSYLSCDLQVSPINPKQVWRFVCELLKRTSLGKWRINAALFAKEKWWLEGIYFSGVCASNKAEADQNAQSERDLMRKTRHKTSCVEESSCSGTR